MGPENKMSVLKFDQRLSVINLFSVSLSPQPLSVCLSLKGHNKTRMFVFHGGVNGAYEAIYHGVPVVGIPLFADQVDNMLRLRSHGMAEFFDYSIREVTTDGLYEKIMKVATDPR